MKDVNERHREGGLPDDPEADAEPMDPPPPKAAPRRSIVTIGAAELAQPLPELPYLIDKLGIAAGAPVCVAGYGFSGKTMAMQSLGFSVAAGLPVWGVWTAARGRVLHIDYEQGRRLTSERYQRLARGAGVDLASLGDKLHMAEFPEIYLDDSDGADAYARAMDGFELAIVDSFRAAGPKTDENSSEVRKPLDQLARASAKTGCTAIFIHHSRKPKADDPDGAKYKIRGSSALFDACGSVFVFEGSKGGPTMVTHEKCRNRGITLASFGLRIDDVEIDGNARAGLRVVHLEPEQLTANTASPRLDTDAERIRVVLRAQPRFPGNKGALKTVVQMRASNFSAAFSHLEAKGEAMVDTGKDGTFILWTASGDDDAA